MILIDTNVLVALADRCDNHHHRCTKWYDENTSQLLVPSLVISEACYFINKYLGPKQESLFLEDIGTSRSAPFQLVELEESDLRRMAQLVR